MKTIRWEHPTAGQSQQIAVILSAAKNLRRPEKAIANSHESHKIFRFCQEKHLKERAADLDYKSIFEDQ